MNLSEYFSVRTDLADEKNVFWGENSEKDSGGVSVFKKKIENFGVCEVDVENENREKGCPAGKYVTVNIGKVWNADKEYFISACRAVAECIREFIPPTGMCMLAALGNRNITADALGPMCAENFIVTHHIKKADESLFYSLGLRETVCVCPGVLGNTGIEAAKIIKGAAEEAKPDFVIAVDSLASKRLSRLASTVQISSCGIVPGSGINNSRKELSERTLGVPVIAVGVPTVVGVATLAADIVETAAEKSERRSVRTGAEEILKEITSGEAESFFVTPKETDHIIRDVSKLIGYSINMALHSGIEFDEIDELIM